MNFSGINYESFADGEGVRVSLFVSGCTRQCPGCFNKEAWDFNAGDPLSPDVFSSIQEHLNRPYISGLTLLGGEPMEYVNMIGSFTATCVAKSIPNKNVWVYTGYTFEELISRKDVITKMILANTDVLVDGSYNELQRDVTLPFRGSRNQRIIDVQSSLRENRIVLFGNQ